MVFLLNFSRFFNFSRDFITVKFGNGDLLELKLEVRIRYILCSVLFYFSRHIPIKIIIQSNNGKRT